jgi:hypothetical protein
MTTTNSHGCKATAAEEDKGATTVTAGRRASDTSPCNTLERLPLLDGATVPKPLRQVARGITTTTPTTVLRHAIRMRVLSLANRLRVIRTLDVAAHCFPERGFQAALAAAQRAMRALVKALLLRRYRTDRFQTVYALTERGASWLRDINADASASVRRVSDMSNPEHRLWASFIVLAGEARGLKAATESELLAILNPMPARSGAPVLGPLAVSVATSKGRRTKVLRPDALLFESDGATWVEVDRSARGSDRAADLRSLTLSVGGELTTGDVLRRVVVFTRTERIHKRVVALLVQLAKDSSDVALESGRRQLRRLDEGQFEVWRTNERRHDDGRISLVDDLAGHILVQRLPTWLPKFRLDGRDSASTAGWFPENYLPYQRPAALPEWLSPSSPLL